MFSIDHREGVSFVKPFATAAFYGAIFIPFAGLHQYTTVVIATSFIHEIIFNEQLLACVLNIYFVFFLLPWIDMTKYLVAIIKFTAVSFGFFQLFFRFTLFNRILRSISSRRCSLRCNLSISDWWWMRSCCNCESFCTSTCSILCKSCHEMVLAAASTFRFHVIALRKRLFIMSRDCCKRKNFERNFSKRLW